MLLILRKQCAKLEQRGLNGSRIHSIGQSLHHLCGDKATQVFDGGQMRERITAGKFDRTGETVQPLLKLFGGFCRLLQTHSWTYKGGMTTNWDKTRLVCRMFKKTRYFTRPTPTRRDASFHRLGRNPCAIIMSSR